MLFTIDLMKSILFHTNKKGPVLTNSIPLYDQEVIDHDERNMEDEFMNNPDDSDDNICECTTEFGGSSQTETQLSNARLAIDNAPNNNEVIEVSKYYQLALPVYEDMMNSCKTKKQFEDVIKLMETQHIKHVSENGVLPHNNTTKSTFMFGQNDTNQRSIPRKKFAYERRQQYKK